MGTDGLQLRRPTGVDENRLLEMAAGIRLFTGEDVDTVRELWTDYIAHGSESCYQFLTAHKDGEMVGFAAYGHRALTDGVYDLYWIGVDENHHRQGIGDFLLKAVENEVAKSGARILIAETAGKAAFEPTRRFYLGCGYELEARIRDFYTVGDDLVIFTKRFNRRD